VAEDPGAGDFRAALAAQLLQLRPRDLLAQTAVMLANQAAIRLGIVELLQPLVPAEEMEALRGDLAQLRMAFVQAGAEPPPPPPLEEEPADEGPGEERPPIWTPGGEV